MPDGNKITALPLETRRAPLNSFDAKARTATVVVSAGAPVKRYDWNNSRYYMEELVISGSAIDLTRINGAGVSVLNNHDQYSGLDAVLGRASNGRIEGSQLLADVRFSGRDEVAGLVRDIGDGIITDVSVGYARDQIEMLSPPAGQPNAPWTYRITKWTPMEVSFVTVPADPQAGMRSAEKPEAGQRLFPVEFIHPVPAGADHSRKENTMSDGTQTTVPATDPNAAAAAEVARKATETATATERTRGLEIRKAVKIAGLEDAVADDLIGRAIGLDAARAEIFDKLAAKQKESKTDVRGVAHIEMGEDETIKVRAAVASALLHRLIPGTKLDDNGAAEYRHMSLSRIAEDLLERRGIRTRGLNRMELCARAMSTTDFPNVLANVANKRLRQAYEQAPASYRSWARQAPNAPDFKTIQVNVISAAPDFVSKAAGEELKYGSASDGKETYAMATYARGIFFTREAMINDDLNAFNRVVSGFGMSAARLENKLVYLQLANNANLSDGVALFHTTHANITGTGTAIAIASLGICRKQMRVQTGLQGETLNVIPRYLIVPATQEALAYQYTSAQFVPAVSTNVNEFREGGRTALTPVVEAMLDGLTDLAGADKSSTTKWYLAADPGQIDTVEYCYLDGFEGVYLENQIDFDTDAIKFKGRLDFATKVLDYRGLTLNNGA
jgi:hypothetical protein